MQCDCLLTLSIKPKLKIQFLKMNLAKFAALRAKKCKKAFFFFFFLYSISSKITVVKEKAGGKKQERKKEENRIYLWLNS